jgi:mannose-1-phosphate guanylyltransferase
MQKKDVYAIVMAGGKGERFWPQSRMSHPKQLLRLIGSLTLIEQTVERLTPMIPLDNIIVITNKDYVAPMRSLLSEIPADNIIGEPVGRDTAPCVALATAVVKSKSNDENPVMILLPADHVIKDSASLLRCLVDSAEVAKNGNIVTIGIDPGFASTGYGYIHCGNETALNLDTKFYKSLGFKEKPSLEVAKEFLNKGCYKWNSGMFIWSVKTISEAFEKHCPPLREAIKSMLKAARDGTLMSKLDTIYPEFEKISIDYAIMEKVDNVIVANSSFDWDDVGSWTALRNQIKPKENNNVVRGLHEQIDTEDCIIVSDPTHLIATVDVKNIIIVHTEDATLVCKTRSAQKIKELVRQIGSKPELSKFI